MNLVVYDSVASRASSRLFLVILRALRYPLNVIIGDPPVFRHKLVRHFLALLGVFVLLTEPVIPAGKAAEPVDFNRDIRHILSENCFKCHGPDAKQRKGGKNGLRLDTLEGAQIDLGGYRAIVPGQPGKSELVKRITTGNLDDKMPPPNSSKKLPKTDIALLQAWIKQGAAYSRHWSYVKPVRPVLPHVQNKAWANLYGTGTIFRQATLNELMWTSRFLRTCFTSPLFTTSR